MRVVITGATGNVGTSLVRLLSGDPEVEEVVGLARRRPAWDVPKVRWVAADVAGDDLRTHLAGADAVVHLAWLIQPSRDQRTLWAANVEGSANVFRAVADARVGTLVYASSVGAYSPGPKDDPVDESWPTHGVPRSSYSRQKAYVERLLDTFEAEHPHVRSVRLRPGLIFKREAATEQRRYFAGPFFPGSLVRPSVVPAVPHDPRLRFQALHSADAASAYHLALRGDVRGAFNVCSDPVLSTRDLARLLRARAVRVPAALMRSAAAVSWALHLHPLEPGWIDLATSAPVMDTARARHELGWAPSRTATEAIGELLEGLAGSDGFPTPPLDPATSGPLRVREIATGIGER